MIDAVIFDKDGTLFDFRASWGAWTQSLLAELGQPGLGPVLGFDVATCDFAPDSPVIAMTTPEIADIVLPYVPHLTRDALNAVMNRLAAAAPMVPAVDLPAVLGALRARGLKIGLATNDTEAPARAHLTGAGVIELFDFVAGCDSGWGGKPAPGQLLAFVQACGLTPGRVAMVGDSLHDLDAGGAAGTYRLAALTALPTPADPPAHAPAVLPNISRLGDWIDGLSAR